ncbi:YqzG/YhdC family protein [Ornithinibacillus contaminans]|uniref:YqzG/YhdC family protein n=1 Tax=Ornithinibacillus contaminans TaxID=694055 RepID=UPI00064DB764|nr:YqzG/YhdC family protein [Ornithinibacillus contaminans]
MKKFVIKLLCCSLLSFSAISIHPTAEITHAKKEVPPYAKWGRLAMQKTKEKYPNANIVDYLHVGRDKGNKNSTETFKLWLEAPDKEFGVFVDITFDNKTEQIIDVTFREVTS